MDLHDENSQLKYYNGSLWFQVRPTDQFDRLICHTV